MSLPASPTALRRALALLVTLAGVGTAMAQPGADPIPDIRANGANGVNGADAGEAGPARLTELVTMLESPDISLREIATQPLRDNPAVTLEVIERLLRDEAGRALSPEQRLRLETVGQEKFVSRPRGAMGVQFGQFDEGGEGVVVAMTIRGFQSAELLQPGDTILMMDKTPVNMIDDARAAIISHEPGEVVEVQIKRRGEPMTVSLRLGSFAALSNAARLDETTMARAWEMRRARLDPAGSSPPASIETGLSHARFNRLASLAQIEQDRRNEELQQRADPLMPGPVPAPGVVAGGGNRRPAPANAFALSTTAQAVDLARLEQEIRSVQSRLERNRRALANADALRRQRLEQQVQFDQNQLRDLLGRRNRLRMNVAP